jgi:hypothetical protein
METFFWFQSLGVKYAAASAVAVNVTNIKPLAQLLTQNGSAVAGADGPAALLFQPVIQVSCNEWPFNGLY